MQACASKRFTLNQFLCNMYEDHMTFSPVLEEGEAQEGESLFSGDRPMVSGKVGISLTGDFICIYACMYLWTSMFTCMSMHIRMCTDVYRKAKGQLPSVRQEEPGFEMESQT